MGLGLAGGGAAARLAEGDRVADQRQQVKSPNWKRRMVPTNAASDGPSQPPEAPAPRRRRAGVLVGLGILALVVWPAAAAIYFAVASFTGCFLGCSQPEPAVGVLWAAVAAFLLVIPVAAGLVTARVHSPRGWLIAFLAIAALLAIWQVAQTVI